jgi:hypothetical protein
VIIVLSAKVCSSHGNTWGVTSVRIAKWAAELSGYHITFEPKTTIKSQVLADFIVDWTKPITQPDVPAEKVWTIHCDGAWCHAGAGAAAVITSPTGVKHRYAARLSFALESDRCTNNVAEYEAVILAFASYGHLVSLHA